MRVRPTSPRSVGRVSRSHAGVAIAVVLACVSAAIAVMLIIGSIAKGAREGAGTATSPSSTAPLPTQTAPPTSFPASTQSPYEQLKGQMLAILAADGAQKAYDLLAAAVDASPDAAPLCRQVAKDLKAADASLDWAGACR